MTEPVQLDNNVQDQTPVQNDPFSLDENSLVSLSPEQRASLDPIIDGWKKKAIDEISRRDADIGKYKSYEEKAVALDKLSQYQPFLQWWTQHQSQSKTNQVPGQNNVGVSPQDIASNDEWQNAIYEASIGNGQKLQAIQSRLISAFAAPVVADLKEKQEIINTRLEIGDLMSNHPDAKELDQIKIDDDGTTLLESFLDWAEKNGKPLEEGYKRAKRAADSMRVTEQQKSMGMIQEKKQSITLPPSTATGGHSLTEVDNVDDLLRKSMEATLSGNKEARFVLKK